MSHAVVETWIGELAKLGEKVKARKRPFLRKAKHEGEEAEEDMKKESRVVQKRDSSCSNSMLSEATICLLMDRFAPC